MKQAFDTAIRTRGPRRGSAGPTVKDVALAAGVSPMTVSRVINDRASVRVSTRDSVESAIARLNYVPNPAARSLAGGGQFRLALLHDNPSAAFLSELLVGCLDRARQLDAQMLLEPFEPGEPTEALVRRLREHRVEGVLVPAPLCDRTAVMRILVEADFPVARLAATVKSPFGHAIGIDDEAGACAMVEHLIALGHQRIGYIAGSEDIPVSALRLAGFDRGLRKAGIRPDRTLVVRGDYTYRSGLDAADRLLARHPRPTAIFASNDDMAAGAMAAAHRHGLEVPRDLSICGFDDTATARSIWPELTTIRQPAAAMAARGVDILVAHLGQSRRKASSAQRLEEMAFQLVRRASDASPT